MSKPTDSSHTLIHDFQASVVNDVLIAISPTYGEKLSLLLTKFNQNLLTNIVPIISEINTLKGAIINEIVSTPSHSSVDTDNNLTMTIEERDSREEDANQSGLEAYYSLLSGHSHQHSGLVGSCHDSGTALPTLPFGSPWRASVEDSEDEDDEEEDEEDEEEDEEDESADDAPNEITNPSNTENDPDKENGETKLEETE